MSRCLSIITEGKEGITIIDQTIYFRNYGIPALTIGLALATLFRSQQRELPLKTNEDTRSTASVSAKKY